MTQREIEDLHLKGYCILRNWVSNEWLESIRSVLPELFEEHNQIRIKNNNSIVSNGVAMNVLASNDIFIDFLEEMANRSLISDLEDNYFRGECIINSFTALNNIPAEDKLFHKKIHRDIRGFSDRVPILLNMLVMVDDFTAENGGTLLLPYSHLREDKPTEEFFNSNCISATGSAGDIIIWNSNVFHASGINRTDSIRRGLPITLSLPYYKQLLDYPKALGYERMNEFSPIIQRLLGFHSRVPGSISEWYLPDAKRLYK